MNRGTADRVLNVREAGRRSRRRLACSHHCTRPLRAGQARARERADQQADSARAHAGHPPAGSACRAGPTRPCPSFARLQAKASTFNRPASPQRTVNTDGFKFNKETQLVPVLAGAVEESLNDEVEVRTCGLNGGPHKEF